MCGIYALAAYGLINIYNMVQFISVMATMRNTVGMIVTILVYLPEVVFYFFVIKFMIG